MKDNVFCWKCDKMFSVQDDEYYNGREENTFTVVRCPYCNEPNSIYFSISHSFHATQVSQEDRKAFKPEIEDESCVGQKV